MHNPNVAPAKAGAQRLRFFAQMAKSLGSGVRGNDAGTEERSLGSRVRENDAVAWALAMSMLVAIALAAPLAIGQQPKPAAPLATAAIAATAAPATSAARTAPAAVPLPYKSTDVSMGVVNCANSLCHGSVKPLKDSNVLHTEYVTWSRVDRHARAYQVLNNELSMRIARNLGIAKPVESPLCLDCHTHNVAKARRGERFQLDDGVSCEACHGPSGGPASGSGASATATGGWLQSHVQDGATHVGNLDAGLYPTAEPLARAKLCLSCHFGNADRFVTHRMMGAGHPRMAFELDTFTAVEPAHFNADADWEKRKRLWDGVQVWAIGQALAVSETMSVLTDPKRGRDGLFPELVLFDCHACHHPMSDKRWTPRTPGLGPGAVRLNDSNMLMVRQIAKVVDPTMGARIAETMTRLQQDVSKGNDALTDAQALRKEMAALIPVLETHSFTDADMRRLLAGLIDEGLNGQYHDYAGAEQATMAIGSVASFMYKRGMLRSAGNVNRGLDALQKSVAHDEQYSPAKFQAALKSFRSTVGP